jgi:hypothetical protein
LCRAAKDELKAAEASLEALAASFSELEQGAEQVRTVEGDLTSGRDS